MRITARGQVTIPKAIRERTGLVPGTEVELVVDDGSVRVARASDPLPPSRGAAAVERLRGAAGRSPMTTDELMALTRGEG
jgi:antitoxin PrlF